MKPKVLWIEDGGRFELASLCGPVLYKGQCDLTLAEDVSTAVDHLEAEEWHALIVDIRLPPGVGEHWRRLYRRTGSDKVHSQLGLKLVEWLVRGGSEICPDPPPSWIRPERIGVFTVESWREVGDHLKSIGRPSNKSWRTSPTRSWRRSSGSCSRRPERRRRAEPDPLRRLRDAARVPGRLARGRPADASGRDPPAAREAR